jgi:hypothetical protein
MLSRFFPENRAVYETMRKKHGKARQATDDNTLRRIRFACWTTKATDTHSEYVKLIAFTRQPQLCERALMLILCTFAVLCVMI